MAEELKKEHLIMSDVQGEIASTGHYDFEDNVVEGYENVTFYKTDEDFITGRKNYVFFLSHFDGPLDLLLFMLKNKKLDIDELFVSDITKQYLEIISKVEKFDEAELAYAGEFLTTASELIYIKSVHILPTEDDASIEAEEAQKSIIDRLKEYEMFKTMSQRIKELETTNRFYREPVYTDEDYRLSIKNFSMDKLLDAYARLIDRLNRREADIEPKKVMKERFSVSNRISYIAQRIFSEKKLDLFSLFDEDFTRLEIVNTFLALLELVKRQVIKTTQDDTFGDIYLELAEGALPINLEGDNEFEQH
ncbi:MAG: segregation/condensation protein A [Eubacteriales bacterium]|jgi:segregation and condensation protein A|nr:segregation/condensation protein A [Eubacteriales bacterium]